MADSVSLVVTDKDGTVYTVSGTLTAATVSVQPPAPPTITAVQVSAAPGTVQTGAQLQCGATVTGTGAFSQNVNWSATGGSIDAAGLFTAPATPGPVTIFATSAEDPTKQGAAAISVVAPSPAPTGAPAIPATADVVDMLTNTPPWQMNHDAGTPGSSTGTTAWPVAAPDGTQNCRRFDFTLAAHGGEIYHKSVMRDASKFSNYCYEAEELCPDESNVENEEKDIEQIDAKGNKLDMATQEAGDTEEVTGKPSGWTKTLVHGVDPSTRTANVWYVIRKYFKNNGDGTVTYQGLEIFQSGQQSVYMPINMTLNDTKASNWGANDLNFQYQFDGKTSGSAQTTVYARKLNVYCW